MDPFLPKFKNDKLYCLFTGRVMQNDLADDILSVEKQRETGYEEFRIQCLAEKIY